MLARFADAVESTAPGDAFAKQVMLAHCVWYPRVKARRRDAEVLRDPQAAERHAREDRRRKLWATAASGIIAAIVVAAWIR